MNNTMCANCNSQCKDGCNGSGPDNCMECLNVLDDTHCVETCPDNKYNKTGKCVQCHETCIGCNGPRDTVSPDGCTTCHRAIINADNIIEKCLRKNESCPGQNFFHGFECIQLYVLICLKCLINAYLT